jgi:hypothetical protein
MSYHFFHLQKIKNRERLYELQTWSPGRHQFSWRGQCQMWKCGDHFPPAGPTSLPGRQPIGHKEQTPGRKSSREPLFRVKCIPTVGGGLRLCAYTWVWDKGIAVTFPSQFSSFSQLVVTALSVSWASTLSSPYQGDTSSQLSVLMSPPWGSLL